MVQTVLQVLGVRGSRHTGIGEHQQAGGVLVLEGGVAQLFIIDLAQVVPHGRFRSPGKELG
ncbi:MAG: hypothetical protein ACRYFZ_05495 [Janthinobacterium lividum]